MAFFDIIIFFKKWLNNKMKCAFLLESPDISGGTYVIFEHAIRMAKRGNIITIITEEPIDKNRLNWYPEARKLSWMTYKMAKSINFDIVIATWWHTVYKLYSLTLWVL